MNAGRWLLIWDLGGFQLRACEGEEDVTIDEEVYGPWLRVDALGRGAETAQPSVQGWEPEGGWAAYWSTHGPPEERQATLYWHRDGQTLQQARKVLDGVTDDVQYGGVGEAIDFRLRRVAGGQELMPPATAAVTTSDWSTAAEAALGKNPPIIFGFPGSRASNTLPAVPALYVSVGGTPFLAVAQGSIAATTCTVSRVSGGIGTYSEWTGAAVTEVTRSGRTVSVIQGSTGAPASFHVDDGEYYVAFDEDDATHGGVANWDGSVRRGAADVMLWVLEQYSSIDIDRARWAREADWLNAYKVDTYVDSPILPLEWIERALLPYLPVRLRQGRNGLWLQPQRYAATAAQVVRHLSVERGQIRRAGRIGRRDPVYTRYSVSYRYGRGRFYGQRTLGPLPGILNQTPGGFDVRELGRLDLRLAELRFGVRQAPLIECDITWDNATATRILQDQADQYGWPKRAIQYVGSLDLDTIEPGQFVQVSDAEIGAADVIALVEEVTVSREEVVLDLTMLDRPA